MFIYLTVLPIRGLKYKKYVYAYKNNEAWTEWPMQDIVTYYTRPTHKQGHTKAYTHLKIRQTDTHAYRENCGLANGAYNNDWICLECLLYVYVVLMFTYYSTSNKELCFVANSKM